MSGTTNRFKRNAAAGGVEPKTPKNEAPETIEETVEAAVETVVETVAPEKTEEPKATEPIPTPTPASAVDNADANMTVALNGMIDLRHRFVKREPKSKQIPLNITPTVQAQLQFLVDNNMVKSRNDFIFQLVETALASIFSNQEILDEFNKTNKWEK